MCTRLIMDGLQVAAPQCESDIPRSADLRGFHFRIHRWHLSVRRRSYAHAETIEDREYRAGNRTRRPRPLRDPRSATNRDLPALRPFLALVRTSGDVDYRDNDGNRVFAAIEFHN